MITERLAAIIEEGIAAGAFPGANIAVVGRDVSLGSYGDRALYPAREKNSLDTRYDMASLTKVVCTTTCLLKLLEEGYFRLYDPVSLFLPRFRHEDVTLRDLVTHTSGLAPCLPHVLGIKSREEALDVLYDQDLLYPKNDKITYSDQNYILVGLVIEAVTGMSLDAFAKKAVFDPLGMKDTGFNPTDATICAPTEKRDDDIVKGIVRGKVHDETAYILGGVAGHAGLFSTASDCARFIEMILNEGTLDGQRILSPATVRALFMPSVANYTGSFVRPTDRRSIGWILSEENTSASDFLSEEAILHTGFTGTSLWIDRKNQVGCALLSNRVHPTRDNHRHFTVRVRVGNYVISHYGNERGRS